ncbi:hypothetical protein VA596_35115 [Amycolatopsis sp., V23-08]|uniref:Uncharacterized protein n=1 Tax=Amycolatopsis heterodermiae TaxID=3110235 RepID=A0ABU5REW5_9PSEU|nr:hypothetical protein [Amycolatopsis sp., V23-08]MEA5364808.1 hypothetical protein [Amycolatopsis sp., V23-08]
MSSLAPSRWRLPVPPRPSSTERKHEVKLEAKAEKNRLKVGEETKINGSFADPSGQKPLSRASA